MALPQSSMSSVFALDASLIANPVANSLAVTPAFGCPPVPNPGIPGLSVKAVCLRILDGAKFVEFRGGVAFEHALRVSLRTEITLPIPGFSLGTIQIDCEARVRLAISATTPGTPWGLALALTYPATPSPPGDQLELTCETVEDPLRTSIENAVRDALDEVLRNAPIPEIPPIALGGMLTSQTPGGPVGLVIADASSPGSTLLVGLAFASDGDANPSTFQGSFDPLSFAAPTEWVLEIDSAAMLEDVAAMAPPGGPIPGLPGLLTGALGLVGATITTGPTTFLWTGGTIPTSVPSTGTPSVPMDPADVAEITSIFNDHPVWFVAPIDVVFPGQTPIRSGYVIGHIGIDLMANGSLSIDPQVLRARYLGLTIPMPVTQLPKSVVPALPAPVRITDLTYDPARLRLLGLDDSSVYAGPPEIDVPSKLTLSNGGGPCGSGIGPSGDVTETFVIRNGGGSPLWICGMELEPAGVFSVQHPQQGAEPFSIAPDGWLSVEVTLEAEDFTEHTGVLRIEHSDCAHAPSEVELVAERLTDAELQLRHETCFEHIPEGPEGFWGDFERMLGRAHRELEPAGGTIDPEDRDVVMVDVLLRGYPNDALLVTDEHTRTTLVQRRTAAGRYLALPLGVASAPAFATSKSAWSSPPGLNLRLNHAVVEGRFADGEPIEELAADGPLVLARSRESVRAYLVDTALSVREAGTLDAKGNIEFLGVRGRTAWLIGSGVASTFDLGDPGSPRAISRSKCPTGTVYATDDGLVVLREEGVVDVFSIEADGPRLTAAWRPSVELTNFERIGAGGFFFGPRGALAVADLAGATLEAAPLHPVGELPRASFQNLERAPAARRWIDRGAHILDALTPSTGFYVRKRTSGRTRWNLPAVEQAFGLRNGEHDPMDLPPLLG